MKNQYYFGNNDLGTKDSFRERRAFILDFEQYSRKELFFADNNPMFFKTHKNLPIAPRFDRLLVSQSPYGSGARILAPVYQAFKELKKYLNDSLLKGRMRSSSTFAQIAIVRGFRDFEQDYAFEKDNIIKQFVEEDQKIKGFNHFVDKFSKFLVFRGKTLPITKTALILSSNIFSTGLAIQYKSIDNSVDAQKTEEIIKDPYFDFFQDAAARFGFLIDARSPNTLVAQPTSTQFLAASGAPNNTEDFIDENFESIVDTEMLYLDFFLKEAYLSYILTHSYLYDGGCLRRVEEVDPNTLTISPERLELIWRAVRGAEAGLSELDLDKIYPKKTIGNFYARRARKFEKYLIASR